MRLIPLAALQHYAFCKRQCGLIHNEQVWSDNYLTAQGNLLHERVDYGVPDSKKGVRFERGVVVSAFKIGITGKLDLLEYHIKSHTYIPVEYKRGRPKSDDIDKVQLCAQALCIEEMTNLPVTKGALWYWQTRKRLDVALDEELRNTTLDVIQKVTELFDSGTTPKPVFTKSCRACSLGDYCFPKLFSRDKTKNYVDTLFCMDSES